MTAGKSSLHRLLEPSAVALLGATPDVAKLSAKVLQFLLASRYQGKVFPINPRYNAIGQLPCFASVDDVPEHFDVLVCTVPVAAALPAIEQAGRRGIPFALIMTGGFGEGVSGERGRERLQELQAICAETGIQVVGPNTVAIINFLAGIPLTFADWYARDTGARDGVAILSHSGSVGGLIFSSLQLVGIGVSHWVGLGNEAGLEAADFIDYFAEQEGQHVIACYLEGIRNGRKFLRAVARARRHGVQVVVLSAGMHGASKRSTLAHAIHEPSSAAVYRAALAQGGVVHVESIDQLTYAVKLLMTMRPGGTSRLGVMSASGGANSLIADHFERAGFELPLLSDKSVSELGQWIPEYGSPQNPIDLSGDVLTRESILTKSLEVVECDEAIDTWILFGRAILDRYPDSILSFAKSSKKNVVLVSGVPLSLDVAQIFEQAGVGVLRDAAECARALGALADAHRLASQEIVEATTRTPVSEEIESTHRAARELNLTLSGEPNNAGLGVLVEVWQDQDFGPVLKFKLTANGLRGPFWHGYGLVPISPFTARASISALNLERDADSFAGHLERLITASSAWYMQDRSVAEFHLDCEWNGSRLALCEATISSSADPNVSSSFGLSDRPITDHSCL